MRGAFGPTDFKETPNTKKNVKETDPGREGPGSRGKQPRSSSKVLKTVLSDKGDNYAITAKR